MPQRPHLALRMKHLWSIQGVRRLTYVLVSGGALAGAAGFMATRPSVDRWILGHLGTYVKAETGLDFQAERLEVHPFQGRFLIHHLVLGGDLLRADRLEVNLELRSLLHNPHIRNLMLVNPFLRVDQERLARIHLKAHPPSQQPLKVRLDHLEISGGQAVIHEPAWGLSQCEFTFRIHGQGKAANQVGLSIQVPALALGAKDRLYGELHLNARLTDKRVDLDKAQLRLGSNTVSLAGGFSFESKLLHAQSEGTADLTEALRLGLPAQPPAASGRVTWKAQAEGPMDHLVWKGAVQGDELKAQQLALHPGKLHLAASGGPGQITLSTLQWDSQEGSLTAQGGWNRSEGVTLKLEAQDIPLAPMAGYTRTGFLRNIQASFQGKATLPGTPWRELHLDQLSLEGSAQFLQNGQQVGDLELSVANRQVNVKELRLDLPETEVDAKARAVLGKRGLESLDSQGEIRTDAKEVAAILKVWDIGSREEDGQVHPFDMEGMTHATAQFSWNHELGPQLTGRVDVVSPRWHGAVADRLGAEVSIDRDVLKVSDIQLEKNAGRGYGELWLTWGKLPPGATAIDMCYRAIQLPILEGLKAADQGDLKIQGTGSGWVRLHGPFESIFMEGQAVAENADIYGLHIPAASTDFTLDLTDLRLRAFDTRVADTLEHLNAPAPGDASGKLALKGAMDMDIPRQLWRVELAGAVDTQTLRLPGPQAQARFEARLDGPIVSPCGPYPMPTGTVHFSKARVSQGQQTFEGLEGTLDLTEGRMALQVGLEGMPQPILDLQALQVGSERIAGTVALNLSPESADTQKLSTDLTQNFLKDARLAYRAHGSWGPEGLAFQGTLDHCTGQFQGFQLVQARPGRLDGNTTGVDFNLELEGHPQISATTTSGATTSADSVTTMAFRGQLPYSSTEALAVKMTGSAHVANLKNLLDHMIQPGQYSLLADTHIGGTARIDLDLGGPREDLTLDGTLELKRGRLSIRTYPQSVENVDFTAIFHGRDILIPETAPLRGTFAQGPLKAWGKITWQVDGLSQYDLHADLEDFQFRNIPEGFELQGSLDATLKGSDKDGGLLKGSLWAKHMAYRADINLSDIIIANALGPQPSITSLDPSDPLARIDLDLELHLGEPWEVDTNLLKLQGRPRGTFKLLGNLSQPGLSGKMDFLPGGRITNIVPAGDVVLERGTVEFKDPAIFNPNIDLQGRVDVSPYVVNLGITGTLDHLRAIPTSTPSLTPNMIFTLLVDPDSASTIDSNAAYSTTGAMNTGLTNSSVGLLSSLALADFQEGLRKTLKLDRVSVAVRSGVGAADTQVVLGKSIPLFGYHVPLVGTYRKTGDATTLSSQLEIRFGDFVLQGGISQTTGSSSQPSGEIRHTWIPK